ncbi:hypothetical protein D3C85_1649110 [compost metagenome]
MRVRKRLISSRISVRSLASRLDSGSSKRKTLGFLTMHRPKATRCCWPPDNCFGLRRISSLSPSISAARSISDLIFASSIFLLRSPNAKLS